MLTWPVLATLMGLSLSVAVDSRSATDESPQQPLSNTDIVAAIELGQTGSPAGYDLIWDVAGPSQPLTIVGRVYTPFLRVALWAHRSAAREETPTPTAGDVPADLLQPTIVIAIKTEPLCCPQLRAGPPLDLKAGLVPSGVMVTSLDDEPVLSRALWITSDLTFLRRFDPDGAEDILAIAAFPVEEIRSGRDVIVAHKRYDDTSGKLMTLITTGSIRQGDLAAWK